MPTHYFVTPTASHTTPVHLNFWYTAIYKINFLTVILHTQFPNSNGFLRMNLFFEHNFLNTHYVPVSLY